MDVYVHVVFPLDGWLGFGDNTRVSSSRNDLKMGVQALHQASSGNTTLTPLTFYHPQRLDAMTQVIANQIAHCV